MFLLEDSPSRPRESQYLTFLALIKLFQFVISYSWWRFAVMWFMAESNLKIHCLSGSSSNVLTWRVEWIITFWSCKLLLYRRSENTPSALIMKEYKWRSAEKKELSKPSLVKRVILQWGSFLCVYTWFSLPCSLVLYWEVQKLYSTADIIHFPLCALIVRFLQLACFGSIVANGEAHAVT